MVAAVALLSAALGSRKPLAAIEAEAAADRSQAGAKLTLVDLLCIGIGSTVGSGVFILTGEVLPIAGPSASLSWLCAGALCLLSALSYIELSMRIPTSGSCYVFAYHALGELAGVVGAACLTLEYGISGAGVARGWSALLASLTGWGRGMFFWYPGTDPDATTPDLYFDCSAGAIMAASVLVCSSGLDIGKVVINSFTALKLLLVAFLIVGGLCAWKVDVFESRQVFFPQGAGGTMRAASALFFGFIGFDEVCCLAGKAERPTHTVPRALAGTLLAAAGVSTLAQFALAVMAPASDAAKWPEAFAARGWEWARVLANVGEVALLPLVVLLSFLPQPELLASMAKDGLLPAAFARANKGGTYVWGSNVSGAAMVVVAAAVPFGVLWNVISLGVLLGFNLTNAALIMVRYGNGGAVTQPIVGRLVAAMWVFSLAGAYSFWKGFAGPALEGEPWQVGALVGGLVSFVAAVVAMIAISRHDEALGEASRDTFRVPGVPFLPGTAIILNFMLMATMGWWSQLYFAICLLVCISTHLALRWALVTETSPQMSKQPSEEEGPSSHCSQNTG